MASLEDVCQIFHIALLGWFSWIVGGDDAGRAGSPPNLGTRSWTGGGNPQAVSNGAVRVCAAYRGLGGTQVSCVDDHRSVLHWAGHNGAIAKIWQGVPELVDVFFQHADIADKAFDLVR